MFGGYSKKDERDRTLAKNFWNGCGKELLRRLDVGFVPNCSTLLAEKECGTCSCIELRKYSYYNRNGEERTRWLYFYDKGKDIKKSNESEEKKHWMMTPIDIEMTKLSVEPETLKFRYLMEEKCWSRGKFAQRYSLLEVDLSGRILRRRIDGERGRKEVLRRFPFPKRQIARINAILYNNFLVRCWGGPPVPIWQFTKEKIAYYLGFHYTEDVNELAERKENSWGDLKALLRSEVGDCAAILLSFTLFSVLKPFFPNFHRLSRDSPYYQVKKYLKEQFAVCISCEDIKKANQLAELCCEIVPKIPDRVRIMDGVKLYWATEKNRDSNISMTEFEAKIIQEAGALWVGRRPSAQVAEQKMCLHLTVPQEASFPTAPFLQPILNYFVAVKSSITMDDFEEFENRVGDAVRARLPSLESELLEIMGRYEYSATRLGKKEESLEEWIENNKYGNDELNCANLLTNLEWELFKDIYKFQEECTEDAALKIEPMRKEIKACLDGAKSDIKKKRKALTRKVRSLDLAYRSVVSDMDGKWNFEVGLKRKMAYLLTSYDYFLRICAPREDRKQMYDQLERALMQACQQFQTSQSVTGNLELLLRKLIEKRRCTRLRGEGSADERVCLWYDPNKREFLLEAATYYSELEKLLPKEPHLTRRDWELFMEEAGLLVTVQRGKQRRRTHEVVARKGIRKKVSVLRIPEEKLTSNSLESKPVEQIMRRMREEPTSYRAVGQAIK